MKKILQMTDPPKFGGKNRARERIGRGVIAKVPPAWENEDAQGEVNSIRRMSAVRNPIMSLTAM